MSARLIALLGVVFAAHSAAALRARTAELRFGDGGGSLDLRLDGVTALLARRRRLRLPRERIHGAFVLARSFALEASPRIPCPGWSTRRGRVGVFGIGQAAQVWSVGSHPVVLALYLRGEPYHRVVCEVDDPVETAASINTWLRGGEQPARGGPRPAPRFVVHQPPRSATRSTSRR